MKLGLNNKIIIKETIHLKLKSMILALVSPGYIIYSIMPPESFELEVWMHHMPFSYIVLNISLEIMRGG